MTMKFQTNRKIVFLVGLLLIVGLWLSLLVVNERKNSGEDYQITENQVVDGWVSFRHPQAGYSFQYPSDWTLEIIETPESVPQIYDDVAIRSKDYTMNREGIHYLEKGAEFRIKAERAKYPSGKEVLENDMLGNEIATNRKIMNVSGIEAVQYDYSFESRGVATQFVKNGLLYSVHYKYGGGDSGDVYRDEYLKFLNTLMVE